MKEDLLREFGNRVKQLRLGKNLSQEKLSQICDIDRTYISGVERGIRNVSLLNIARLAKALDVSPSELLKFGGEDVE